MPYGGIYFLKNCTIPLISGFKKFYTGDFNGDGNMDVVREHAQNNKFYYTFFTYNGNQFVQGNTIETGTNAMVQTADYNGDGKDEIFFLENHSHYAKVYDLDKTLVSSYSFPQSSGDAISCENNFISFLKNYKLDINGNGKVNILASRTYSCINPPLSMCGCTNEGYRSWVEVYELDNNNNFVKIVDQDAVNSLFDGIPGDFNGDGKQDLLCRYDSAQTTIVNIYFSTGTSFEKKTFRNLGLKPGNPIVSINDFNNDGKSDFIYFREGSGGRGGEERQGQHVSDIYTSTGEDFIKESYPSDVLIPSEVIQDTKKVGIGDFDGDGRNELIYSKWNSQCYIQTFNDKQNLLVKEITDGLNRRISFEYKPITDNDCYTETVSSYSFPVSKFRQPLYVVLAMNKNDGNCDSNNGFFYKNARVHRQGKGFLGFEEVTANSSQQNRKTVTQYGYNFTYYNIYPLKQTVTTLSGDSVSRTNYVPNYYTTAAKVVFPYIKTQTTVDKLTGITKETEYVYSSSDHGNPCKITETQGSLIAETVCTWTAKNSAYRNRIDWQITIRKGLGTTFSESKKFEYDSKARLTQQIDYYGHPKSVTTNYSNYDSFGNPRTATATATGCPTITTSSAFDETGRFVLSSTDPLGNTSSAVYNPRTGILTEKTDIAGLKTYYFYDGFQKIRQETTPTDNISYSTGWDISGGNVYKTTVNSQISGLQTVWYNAAGLEVKTQSQGFSGAVVSGKQYNSSGQLYRSYLPGYGSKSSQYIEYLYDKYGRLKSENNIGRITSYSYNGLTTTITRPDGTTESSTLNTSGLTENSTDAAGNSVTYSYNSLGKPETITSNGLATHVRYDDRGFQRLLKDTNFADSILYEYNAYGQLASQTNARHQVTSFLYDAAGRITQQTRPENTLTYQYVPSGNGIGQIQYVRNAGQTVRTYAYTPLGQASSVTERIDNTDYTNSYAYNSNGQPAYRTTPSGMQIAYHYTNGTLSAMRTDNNSLLWQADAVNALGQITESSLGNGLKRVTGYDAYHLPSQIALKNGSTFIDRVDYNFNAANGNLVQRNDVTNSRNEVFSYDNLHRLDSIRLNSGTINRMTYYPNGNINNKFDVGTYQYAGGNHAVSGITGKVSSYSPPVLDIGYTSYNRSASLTRQGSVVKRLDFQYNPDNQRNKTLYYENNTLKKTTYYVGDYEKEVIQGGSTKEYDYICTPDGLSAIAVKTNGSRSLYYVSTDHLGGIRTVTTASKAVQTRYYYDAWGKQTLLAGTGITSRGYTGEEHLSDFGLINLNARLYDPVLGRFMGIDPYVQMPDFTQSFNRYSYALNNPLKYTDPNGENPFLILAGFLFAKWFYDGYKANNGQWNPLKWDYSNANFMIGYSSSGNLFSFGSGWNNSYSLAFGYSSGSFSIGYMQDGVSRMTPVKWKRDEFVWDEELYPTGVIRPSEPNGWERFRNDGIVSRFVYGFLDMFYVYGTGAFGEHGAYHLAGGSASGTELQDAALGTVMSLSPLGWGAKGLSGSSVAKTGSQGGLNLFKWGAAQTTKSTGWKAGDYMLHLPNKGAPKLNWKANYGSLRREMGLGNPIYDSYRLPNGNLIPTSGFLNAERFTLESRGWIYNPIMGAWMPPIK